MRHHRAMVFSVAPTAGWQVRLRARGEEQPGDRGDRHRQKQNCDIASQLTSYAHGVPVATSVVFVPRGLRRTATMRSGEFAFRSAADAGGRNGLMAISSGDAVMTALLSSTREERRAQRGTGSAASAPPPRADPQPTRPTQGGRPRRSLRRPGNNNAVIVYSQGVTLVFG
jgi:hypothetical protein